MRMHSVKYLYLVFLLLSTLSLYSQQWTNQTGGINHKQGADVEIDKRGNIFMAGGFTGPASFGDTTLKGAGYSDIFVTKYDTAGNLIWAHQAGAPGHVSQAWGITADGWGNAVVTGFFGGKTAFGDSIRTSAGLSDIFVAKYDSEGKLKWLQKAGGRNPKYRDQGRDIAFDAGKNVFVVGTFSGPAVFDDTTLAEVNDGNIFLVKYDPDGYMEWARQMGGGTKGLEERVSVKVDTDDNIVVTGDFGGTGVFGNTELESNGGFDAFIAKFDNKGNLVWAKSYGGKGHDWGVDLITDSNDNIIVIGCFQGTVEFEKHRLVARKQSFDVFVAKLNSSGRLFWVEQIGGNNTDWATAITLDGYDNPIITGYFKGRSAFGNAVFESHGKKDIFIAKYNEIGQVMWVQQVGGPGDDEGWSIAAVDSGKTIVTGYFQKSASFGESVLDSEGGSELFIAQVNDPINWEPPLLALEEPVANKPAAVAVSNQPPVSQQETPPAIIPEAALAANTVPARDVTISASTDQPANEDKPQDTNTESETLAANTPEPSSGESIDNVGQGAGAALAATAAAAAAGGAVAASNENEEDEKEPESQLAADIPETPAASPTVAANTTQNAIVGQDTGTVFFEDSALFENESPVDDLSDEIAAASEIAAENEFAPQATTTPETFEFTSVPFVSISSYINDSVVTSQTRQLHTFAPIQQLASVSVITENTLLDSILGTVEIDNSPGANRNRPPEEIITPDSIIMEAVKAVGDISQQIDQPDVSTTVTENLQIVTVNSVVDVPDSVDDAFADSLIYNFLIDTSTSSIYTEVPDESYVSYSDYAEGFPDSIQDLSSTVVDSAALFGSRNSTEETAFAEDGEDQDMPKKKEIPVQVEDPEKGELVDGKLDQETQKVTVIDPETNEEVDVSGYRVITSTDSADLRIGFAEEFEKELLEDSGGQIPINRLASNYIDPHAPAVTFNYSLAEQNAVIFEILDEKGNRVATLVNTTQSAGQHEVSWNKKDKAGKTVESGVYVYRLKAGDFNKAFKLLVLQ